MADKRSIVSLREVYGKRRRNKSASNDEAENEGDFANVNSY